MRLADYANESGIAWPSNATLSRECNLSERAVRKAIAELACDGAIRIESGGGRHLTNRYTVKRNPALNAPFQEKPGTTNPVSRAINPAPHAGNGAPRAPQPSVTIRESSGGGKTPFAFDRELKNRIKRAEKEIEKVKCRGILKDSDWARIKELNSNIKGWNDELLSRK